MHFSVILICYPHLERAGGITYNLNSAIVAFAGYARWQARKVYQTMSYYPILLELGGKKVLVVGGGRVAQRKIETLLEYGALIFIISRELTPNLKRLVEDKKITRLGTDFREQDLDEAFLVIAATDDKRLNHKISESAQKRGQLINAVDQPVDCNYIVPSIVKKGDLLIAISTSGKSPALAKKIREKLDREFGAGYEMFLGLMGRLRGKILSMGLPREENSRIFHEIIDSGILESLAINDWDEVESILYRILPGDIAIKDIVKDYLHSVHP